MNRDSRTLATEFRRARFARLLAVLSLMVAGVSQHGWLLAVSADEPADLIRLTETGEFKQRPAWSPDGHTVIFSQHQPATIQLVRLEIATGELARVTDRNDPEFDAVFSPDGKQLLLVLDRTSGTQGDIEIYRMPSPGGEFLPVAVSAGKLSHEESPCWSPDGTRLAFTSTRDGNQELYVARIPDGEAAVTEWSRLTSHPAIDAHPTWSPDGQWIVFATGRWGDLELARIPHEGGVIERLTESRGLDDYPTWSPDGMRLAFVSNRDGQLDVCLMELSTGHVERVAASEAIETFPAWHPDGSLTFVSNRDGGFDLYRTRRAYSRSAAAAKLPLQ